MCMGYSYGVLLQTIRTVVRIARFKTFGIARATRIRETNKFLNEFSISL